MKASHNHTSSENALRDRWKEGKGQELSRQIKACLLFQISPYDILPLEKHEGRWDFRGLDLTIELPPVIPLPDGRALARQDYRNPDYGDSTQAITNTRFARCDLSFAHVDHMWFERCEFEDVLLCGAYGYHFHDQASVFRKVDFTKADWRFSSLGLEGARYEQCVFARTNLRTAMFYCGYFSDCVFAEVTWSTEVDFNGSHFSRCTLSGKIGQIFFDDLEHEKVQFTLGDTAAASKTASNRLVEMDLSEAQITRLQARETVDVSRVVLPKDHSVILIRNWPSGRERLQRIITQRWDKNPAPAEARLLKRCCEYVPMTLMSFWSRAQLEEWAWDIPSAEDRERVVETCWQALCDISAEQF